MDCCVNCLAVKNSSTFRVDMRVRKTVPGATNSFDILTSKEEVGKYSILIKSQIKLYDTPNNDDYDCITRKLEPCLKQTKNCLGLG